MRVMPFRGSLLLALVMVGGCAVRAASPPAPPLAVPLPGAPNEYRWSPVSWKPGIVLTYNVHAFIERASKTAMETWCRSLRDAGVKEHFMLAWCTYPDVTQAQYTMQMKAVEKTLKGAVRVQVLIEGTELGFFLIGEGGEIQDFVSQTPDAASALQRLRDIIEDPCAKELPSQTVFKVGERVAVKCRDVHGATEFVGFMRLAGRIVAAIRFEADWKDPTSGVVTEAIIGQLGKPLPIIEAVSEREERYVAPEGTVLASYKVTTISGRLEGKPYIFRTIESWTLDLQKSSAL